MNSNCLAMFAFTQAKLQTALRVVSGRRLQRLLEGQIRTELPAAAENAMKPRRGDAIVSPPLGAEPEAVQEARHRSAHWPAEVAVARIRAADVSAQRTALAVGVVGEEEVVEAVVFRCAGDSLD